MEKILKKKRFASALSSKDVTESDVNFIDIILDLKLSVKKATWRKFHRTKSTERQVDSAPYVLLTLSFNALFCIGFKQKQIRRISRKKKHKIRKYKVIYTHVFDGDSSITSRFANRRLVASRINKGYPYLYPFSLTPLGVFLSGYMWQMHAL